MLRVSSFLLSLISFTCAARQPDQSPITFDSTKDIGRTLTATHHTGIGFDFGSNYVTAAVSFPNGTNTIIATLSGTDEYNDIMYRLSLVSSQHLAPPYNNMVDMLHDLPRQKWRQFLRSIGLPSSKEAGVIASMLGPLKNMVEEQLGHPITHGLSSFPTLTALYPEDVWDAFEHVGLIFQQFISWPVVVPDYAANYASQGYSLCKDYKNRTACKKEQHKLDNDWKHGEFSTFNFHLSETALIFSVPVISSPYAYIMFGDSHFEDFNLGLRAKDTIGEDDYWYTVRSRIEQLLAGNKYLWDNWIMHKAFVTGEVVHEEKFREMVKEICTDKGINVEFFVDNSNFLTATGTAELAKRDLYLNPGKPHPTV